MRKYLYNLLYPALILTIGHGGSWSLQLHKLLAFLGGGGGKSGLISFT